MNAPARFTSGSVWSLWDMLEIDSGEFVAAVGFINSTGQLLVLLEGMKQYPIMIQRHIDDIRAHVEVIKRVAENVDLPGTAKVCRDVLAEIDRFPSPDPQGNRALDAETTARFQGAIVRLQTTPKDEASGRSFLALTAAGGTLWAPKRPLFGDAAYDAFPSAREDIEEAAKCLAVERGTACVMHLMRAIEVPLKALATSLGIGQQNDWGSYIREIDKELDARLEAAGRRSADEAFYAEIIEAFDRVKRAWRNRTMHIDQTYTVERAQRIYDATRDFMDHLALRVKE